MYNSSKQSVINKIKTYVSIIFDTYKVVRITKTTTDVTSLIENPFENSSFSNVIFLAPESLFKNVKFEPNDITGKRRKIILFKKEITPYSD